MLGIDLVREPEGTTLSSDLVTMMHGLGWRLMQPVAWFKYFHGAEARREIAAANRAMSFIRKRLETLRSLSDNGGTKINMLSAMVKHIYNCCARRAVILRNERSPTTHRSTAN